MVCRGYPHTWVNSVSGSISPGTGGRSKARLAVISRKPCRASSIRTAPQNAALTERISGRLYIGRLARPGAADRTGMRSPSAAVFGVQLREERVLPVARLLLQGADPSQIFGDLDRILGCQREPHIGILKHLGEKLRWQ